MGKKSWLKEVDSTFMYASIAGMGKDSFAFLRPGRGFYPKACTHLFDPFWWLCRESLIAVILLGFNLIWARRSSS